MDNRNLAIVLALQNTTRNSCAVSNVGVTRNVVYSSDMSPISLSRNAGTLRALPLCMTTTNYGTTCTEPSTTSSHVDEVEDCDDPDEYEARILDAEARDRDDETARDAAKS